MSHRREMKFGGRRLLQVLAAGSCVSLSLASHLDMRSSGNKAMKDLTASRRTDSDTEECKENLLEASRSHEFMFTKDAYLEFIEKQSNGSIDKSTFDSSVLGLAHEYWIVTCKVNPGGCTSDTDVSVYDVMNYSDNGSDLITEFCARVNGVLKDLVPPVPTKHPSKAPANMPTEMDVPVPTRSPSPTKTPTLSPTKAPTKSPTKGPTLAPTMSPMKGPTTVPTKGPTGPPSLPPIPLASEPPSPAPVPLASEPPTSNPSPNPSVEKYDLSQCILYSGAWNFEMITNNGNCVSAMELIAEGRITCNSECPAACPKCNQCLSRHLDCPSSTLSPSPTSSPTSRDSFTLTFSIGYDIDNPEEVMIELTEDVVFEVLEKFDPDCKKETRTSCSISSNVSTSLIVRNCDSFNPPFDEEECALADLTVAISSTDPFLGEIIETIQSSVTISIEADLGDRLSPSGVTLLVGP